jgi:predicted Zn-dependent protease
MDSFLKSLRTTDPATAELVRALHDRFPPSINMLNSDAIKVLLSPSPTPAELNRAREMLTKAVAIKPTSANLTGNLGSVLFTQQNYADCIALLETSERLRAQRKLPPSALSLLRLAIATQALNDPRAADYHARAQQVIAAQSLHADPEVVGLLKRFNAQLPAN